ncbi:hypothetical protein QBC36DRAFT_64065 [Triangularia setosa]|uniref:Secreted protein n=1 Tax=Triangularia setosa TaxID=2587417 RepID=A0AAN7A5C8_9PEZI|nr:hypothetical protein QBC36DRAFT_64065 [Podospora setosa]
MEFEAIQHATLWPIIAIFLAYFCSGPSSSATTRPVLKEQHVFHRWRQEVGGVRAVSCSAVTSSCSRNHTIQRCSCNQLVSDLSFLPSRNRLIPDYPPHLSKHYHHHHHHHHRQSLPSASDNDNGTTARPALHDAA